MGSHCSPAHRGNRPKSFAPAITPDLSRKRGDHGIGPVTETGCFLPDPIAAPL